MINTAHTAENTGTKFKKTPARPGPINSTPRIKNTWDKKDGNNATYNTTSHPC